MSCLFKLFRKKKTPPEENSPSTPKPKRTPSQTFSIPVFGPLPYNLEHLQILEVEIGRRMTYLNGKSSKLYSNAAHCQGKGDIQKALLYIRQRKEVVEEITRLGTKLVEVQNRIGEITPPKIEVASPLSVLYIK